MDFAYINRPTLLTEIFFSQLNLAKMKHLHFKRLLAITSFFTLLFSNGPLRAQVKLSATGSGTAYALIDSKGFGNENPDCKHPSFGPHVTQAFDNALNKYVFVFHSHAVNDDDRCTNEDRVRMEIKGGSGSPADMQHTQGQTAYYRWKFKLDAGFIPSSRFTHIFQIKAIDGDAGAPLITITPRAGNPQKMQIIHSSGEGSGSLGTVKEADLAPFKGNWVEAYVKYKSSDGSGGTIELTLRRVSDGAVLLTYTNNSLDMWRTGASYNRGKWGVYRGKDAVLRDEQVRFNDFCITESSAGLCPSGIGSNITLAGAARQDTTEITMHAVNSSINSFPNPFRENSIITFVLNQPAHTHLSVYDVSGKQVAVLVNGMLQTGIHKTVFNASHLPSGVYALKLMQNGKIITRKLLKE
jgi:hypothetical protein